MRILGPDGQPLSSTPQLSEEVQDVLERARAVAAEGDKQSALQQLALAFQTDVDSPEVLDLTVDLLRQMALDNGMQSSDELRLFEYVRENLDDPAGYYQVGNRFFQLRQPSLARPFLAKAKALIGDAKNELAQAIDVDYAQTVMDLGEYEEAINAFHEFNDAYGSLPVWLIMEMAECYALMRQIDEAEAVYQIAPEDVASQIAGMEQVRDEVGDLIARVRDYGEEEELDIRAWHYVQTRGMVVETNPDENTPGGRFVLFQPSEEDVAYVVGLTAAVLDAKEMTPNKIVWLGESSEPIARLFASWWEIEPNDLRLYQPGDNTDSEDELTLFVTAHSTDIADEPTYMDLVQARSGLIMFTLDVRWTERQPLVPDIAGFLSQACNLPWETRLELSEDQQTVTQIEESRPVPEIVETMASQFPTEEECDEWAEELLGFYESATDLILDHRDGSLNRRSLPAHSPIKGVRFGI